MCGIVVAGQIVVAGVDNKLRRLCWNTVSNEVYFSVS